MAPNVAKQAQAIFGERNARAEIAAYLADPATLAAWSAASFIQQTDVFTSACRHGALAALPLIQRAMSPRTLSARNARRLASIALANARPDELDLLRQHAGVFGEDIEFATRDCLCEAAACGNVPALEWAAAQLPPGDAIDAGDAGTVLAAAIESEEGTQFGAMDWLLRAGYITPENFADGFSGAIIEALACPYGDLIAPVPVFEWVRATGLPVAALKYIERGDDAERQYEGDLSVVLLLYCIGKKTDPDDIRAAVAGIDWLQAHCPVRADDIDPNAFLTLPELSRSAFAMQWACRLVADLGLWSAVDQCQVIRRLEHHGRHAPFATAEEFRSVLFDIGWSKTAEVGIALLEIVSRWPGWRADKSRAFYFGSSERADRCTEGDLLQWVRQIEREWPLAPADIRRRADRLVSNAARGDNVSLIVHWCAAYDLDYGAIARTPEWIEAVLVNLVSKTVRAKIPLAEQLALFRKYGLPEADLTDATRSDILSWLATASCITALPYVHDFCKADAAYYRRSEYDAIVAMLDMASDEADYTAELCSFWEYRCGLSRDELTAALVARIRRQRYIDVDYEECNTHLLHVLVKHLGFTIRDMRAAGFELLAPALTQQHQRRYLFQIFDFTVDDIDALVQLVPPLPPHPPFRFDPNRYGDIDEQRRQRRRVRAAIVQDHRSSMAFLLARRAETSRRA